MKKFSMNVPDILIVIFSLALCFGTKFGFHACGPKENGDWAELAVTGIGAALSVLSIVRLCLSDAKIKIGTDLAIFPFALLAAILPGFIIPLCGMKDMRCHSVMRPAVIIVSLLIIAAVVADCLLRLKNVRSKR